MSDRARRLLLVEGERSAALPGLVQQLGDLPDGALLWVADEGPECIASVLPRDLSHRLGEECRILVFDAHSGFHPDAFAAAVGMLRGGGDCIVLVPERWSGFRDPDQARLIAYPRGLSEALDGFLTRISRLWSTGDGVAHSVSAASIAVRVAPPPGGRVTLTADQQEAAKRIRRVALGHARRPLVLTADRGRGKSTVLGMTSAELLREGVRRILVVAANKRAVSTLFRHAAGANPDAISDDTRSLSFGTGQLVFRRPGELGDDVRPGAVDLVIVDEAAALPVDCLQYLVDRYNRLVFATTVHGYEGSGRGFELRFQARLAEAMPQWRAYRLQSPVRWSVHDPLERLVNRTLLLDVELDDCASLDESCRIQKIESKRLAHDEPMLRALFGLLVHAHYQTRPSDLRQLLDNPDLMIWVTRSGEHIVAAALVLPEGQFPADLSAQIMQGKRRPRGHMLPQSLAVHAGLSPVLGMAVWRVQRIAVSPRLRRRGLGRSLLQHVERCAGERGVDVIGAAFAADQALTRFWLAAAFEPGRLGSRLDPATAAHALFMLKGLSPSGAALVEEASHRFRKDLPWQLGGTASRLDPALAALLLQGRDMGDLALDDAEREELCRLLNGQRVWDSAQGLLWRALVEQCALGDAAPASLAPLVERVIQGRKAGDGKSGSDGLAAHWRALLDSRCHPGHGPVDGHSGRA